ncbi:hypothetical protein M5689_020633 [Euphorbia peplus]|nr:hypothetical protein M5689_010917 [Euphorbia peplus]WCJ39661.1 hypothetical protein M5689_020633 [Euphorbia peplus]
MAGRLNLKVHHGGKFSTGTPLTYDGGATTNYRNIEKASLSYSSLVDIAKDVGEGNNVKIYYIIPGFTLESGADLVPYNNEEAVTKMVSLSDGDAYLEIFFEENDQGVSENSPIVLESSVGDTMTKV